jgi:DNA-binding transcriptional MerR regulator
VDASWTISELSERVADALATSGELPGGKARAVPDERAIRYYTTLGLIDRASLKGRTAYYGARHLAQLVAIKKMQADGASLADIQALLPAIDDARLTELTGVTLAPRPAPAARQDFWRTPAVASATAEPEPGSDRTAHALQASFAAEHVLELAAGVRLAISASRVPTDADADAVRAAASAVLAELARRRLV